MAKTIKFLTKTDGAAGELSVKYADIETIKFLPDNIKAHSITKIRALIQKFGFVEPIGINRRTGHDIFGNGRLETLLIMLSDGEKCPKGIIERYFEKNASNGQQIGLKQAPKADQKGKYTRKWYAPVVDGLDYEETDEIMLAIGMNRSQELGGIDSARAYDVLDRLRKLDPANLETVGYDKEAMDRIRQLVNFNKKLDEANELAGSRINVLDTDSESREDIVARLNKKWKVKTGDLWQIGQHRLACLDATNALAVEKTFGESVRLCFTSPPYDNQRNYEGQDVNFTQLMIGASKTMFQMAGKTFDLLVNLGPVFEDNRHKEYWRGWQDYVEKVLGQPVYAFYIWDKLFGYPGNYRGRLGRCHEYIFHFSVGHASANKWVETTGESLKRGPIGHRLRKSDASLKHFDSPATIGQAYKIPDSVIRINADMTRGIHTQGHPAVFPVALAEFMIKTWTEIGDAVFDPFAGSGSTMLAAQNLDRRCLAVDVEPKYCALILERMSEAYPELEVKKLP